MPWLRMDTAFARHRKVVRLSDADFRRHVTAMLWCAEAETDGLIECVDLPAVWPGMSRAAAAKAAERLRCDAARTRIESGAAPSLDRLAAATGFGHAERMRRAFVRTYGHPPQAVRRATAG